MLYFYKNSSRAKHVYIKANLSRTAKKLFNFRKKLYVFLLKV